MNKLLFTLIACTITSPVVCSSQVQITFIRIFDNTNNANTGTATVTLEATGGSGKYLYTADQGIQLDKTGIFNRVPGASTTTFTATDSKDSTNRSTVAITIAPLTNNPFHFIDFALHSLCGNNTGALDVTVNFNSGAITKATCILTENGTNIQGEILQQNGELFEIFSPLKGHAQPTYVADVQTSINNGPIAPAVSLKFGLVQNEPLAIQVTTTPDVPPVGGTVTVIAAGGSGKFSGFLFDCTTGAEFDATGLSPLVMSNVPAGSYSLTVADSANQSNCQVFVPQVVVITNAILTFIKTKYC